MSFRSRTVIYIGAALAVLSAASALCCLGGLGRLLDRAPDMNCFDLLTAQIANTLIVLSLTSVLSGSFGQAYWVDIKTEKLIRPFWGCFVGITVYLLTGTAFSVVSYAAGFREGVAVSALGATLLLVVLTFKMISIYFGKEELKRSLRINYRYLQLVNNTPYVSDYLRRAERFLQEIGNEDFSGKRRFLRARRAELERIRVQLDAKDEKTVDACHQAYLDTHFQAVEQLKAIDLKIREYTRNAIVQNDTVVVRENIGLLADSENYDLFLDLAEDLFDWDETYTCQMLRALGRKNMAWIGRDRISFFKQYALHKLITDSGKLSAIKLLLMICDPDNKGMDGLMPQIREIAQACEELKKQETAMARQAADAEDLTACFREQKKQRQQIQDEQDRLKSRLGEILAGAKTKDLRSFYLPIREALTAFDCGDYDVVNRYVTVILNVVEQDIYTIWALSEISRFHPAMEFTFSYVTAGEMALIRQLADKDEQTMAIPDQHKQWLLSLGRVRISSDPMFGINGSTLEIFRRTLDLPDDEGGQAL